MGRTGIGYAEVADTALALQAEGKAVTVDAVRNALGTGSKTTINQHLKQWKSEQEHNETTIPQALQTVVTGLWERLKAESALIVDEISEKHRIECENLQSLLSEAQRSQQLSEQLTQELEMQLKSSATQIENLHREVHQLKHVLLQLEERYHATNTQLTESKSENVRMHQLASQMQTNLEHYQHAIEKLRIEQALENEKHQALSQAQLMDLRKQLQASELSYAVQAQTLNQLEQKISQQSLEYTKLTQIAEQHDRQNNILQDRLSQLQQTLLTERSAKQAYQAQIQVLEQRNAILDDQNQRYESVLEKLNDKIAALEQEKNQLLTEKFVLQAMQKQTEPES